MQWCDLRHGSRREEVCTPFFGRNMHSDGKQRESLAGGFGCVSGSSRLLINRQGQCQANQARLRMRGVCTKVMHLFSVSDMVRAQRPGSDDPTHVQARVMCSCISKQLGHVETVLMDAFCMHTLPRMGVNKTSTRKGDNKSTRKRLRVTPQAT